jgi:hypothetical protein
VDGIPLLLQGIQLVEDLAGQPGGYVITADKNRVASGVDGDVDAFGNFLQVDISLTEKLAGEIDVREFNSGLLVFDNFCHLLQGPGVDAR